MIRKPVLTADQSPASCSLHLEQGGLLKIMHHGEAVVAFTYVSCPHNLIFYITSRYLSTITGDWFAGLLMDLQIHRCESISLKICVLFAYKLYRSAHVFKTSFSFLIISDICKCYANSGYSVLFRNTEKVCIWLANTQ